MSRNPRVGQALSRIRQRVWQEQEAYSDFFPSAAIGYQGTWNRYKVGAGAFGPPDHVSRYGAAVAQRRIMGDRNPRRGPQVDVDYPYRIDPWKRFSGTLAVTQPIYQGGLTVSNFNIAKLQVTNSELQLQVDRQDLILEVYQAYYQMMLAKLLLEVNAESISTLEKLKSLNEKFLRAGTVTKTDVLSTEGQLYSAYVERRGFMRDMAAARAKLNNLLSNPPETPVEIERDYKQRSNPYRIPQIYNTAMTNRDEIIQANILIRQGVEATKAANAALLPKVSLVGQGTKRTMTGTFSIRRATTIGLLQDYSRGLSIYSGTIQRLRKKEMR